MQIGNSSDLVLTDVSWPDAELGTMTIDYDAVVLTVRESAGLDTHRPVRGYIDTDADLGRSCRPRRAHGFRPATDRCTWTSHSVGVPTGPTPATAANNRQWRAFIVHLSDGAMLRSSRRDSP
jgi:hypothetical protein